MARLTFSPLIAGISGKAGDAVFSKWKGRSYVRKLVTPANPNTAAQQLVRSSMGRLPRQWRSFESKVKTAQDIYGTTLGISGFNWFTKENRVFEQTFNTREILPPNISYDGAATITLTDQTGGSLKVDWTGGDQGADSFIYILSRLIESGEEVDTWVLQDSGSTLVSAGTKTISLTASKEFEIVIAAENTVLNIFGQSVGDNVQLGA